MEDDNFSDNIYVNNNTNSQIEAADYVKDADYVVNLSDNNPNSYVDDVFKADEAIHSLEQNNNNNTETSSTSDSSIPLLTTASTDDKGATTSTRDMFRLVFEKIGMKLLSIIQYFFLAIAILTFIGVVGTGIASVVILYQTPLYERSVHGVDELTVIAMNEQITLRGSFVAPTTFTDKYQTHTFQVGIQKTNATNNINTAIHYNIPYKASAFFGWLFKSDIASINNNNIEMHSNIATVSKIRQSASNIALDDFETTQSTIISQESSTDSSSYNSDDDDPSSTITACASFLTSGQQPITIVGRVGSLPYNSKCTGDYCNHSTSTSTVWDRNTILPSDSCPNRKYEVFTICPDYTGNIYFVASFSNELAIPNVNYTFDIELSQELCKVGDTSYFCECELRRVNGLPYDLRSALQGVSLALYITAGVCLGSTLLMVIILILKKQYKNTALSAQKKNYGATVEIPTYNNAHSSSGNYNSPNNATLYQT